VSDADLSRWLDPSPPLAVDGDDVMRAPRRRPNVLPPDERLLPPGASDKTEGEPAETRPA
jgi:hypothetical protein